MQVAFGFGRTTLFCSTGLSTRLRVEDSDIGGGIELEVNQVRGSIVACCGAVGTTDVDVETAGSVVVVFGRKGCVVGGGFSVSVSMSSSVVISDSGVRKLKESLRKSLYGELSRVVVITDLLFLSSIISLMLRGLSRVGDMWGEAVEFDWKVVRLKLVVVKVNGLPVCSGMVVEVAREDAVVG